MRRYSALILFGLILGFGTIATIQASRPDISRAEAVAIAVDSQPQLRSRLQYYIGHMPPMGLFVDANPKAWYGPYLETAFEAGIINGNAADRTFRPKDSITAEETAALMLKLRHGDQVVLSAPGTPWYSIAISQASSEGIQMPRPLYIGSPITQDQFYAMMRSAGVNRPEEIALTINPSVGYLPKPTVVASTLGIQPLTQTAQPQAVTPPRATTTTPARIQPLTTTTTRVAQANTTNYVPNTTVSNAHPIADTRFSITMPSLNINNLTITHPSDPFTSKGLLAPLQAGVGHLFTYPGHVGKILIYGHSSSYPWDVSPYTKIFRQINKLNIGDKVYIHYDGNEYAYQVTYKQAVPAGDMSAYQSAGEEELILYTCWPPDSISQRYLVHAKPI